jgi:hypothetical protein
MLQVTNPQLNSSLPLSPRQMSRFPQLKNPMRPLLYRKIPRCWTPTSSQSIPLDSFHLTLATLEEHPRLRPQSPRSQWMKDILSTWTGQWAQQIHSITTRDQRPQCRTARIFRTIPSTAVVEYPAGLKMEAVQVPSLISRIHSSFPLYQKARERPCTVTTTTPSNPPSNPPLSTISLATKREPTRHGPPIKVPTFGLLISSTSRTLP